MNLETAYLLVVIAVMTSLLVGAAIYISGGPMFPPGR